MKFSFWDIRDKSRKEGKGWRLDYCIVSKGIKHAVKESEIYPQYWGSDHCPVSVDLDLDKIDLEEFKRQYGMEEEKEEKRKLDMEDAVNS